MVRPRAPVNFTGRADIDSLLTHTAAHPRFNNHSPLASAGAAMQNGNQA